MTKPNTEIIRLDPVKSFFVHMLTRDILLKEAIFDLIDNCIDGIQRSETSAKLARKKPYEKYWVKIKLSKDEFVIEDNCGGIPWKCHEYAFRMGRPSGLAIDEGLKTVGAYGIGMKRAIFKMGTDCKIETHSSDKSYSIHMDSKWIRTEENWGLPAVFIKSKKPFGTSIKISKVYPGIAKQFMSEQFQNEFRGAVAKHFSFIIDKGLSVYINNKLVVPKSLKVIYDLKKNKDSIRPFIYKANISGVDVFLTVGFTRPIPSVDEVAEGNDNFKEQYSSEDAGWSVICNDRTVLYCDKTPVTGWGISGVPQYHTQFIAISGIVVFTSDKAGLLPTTTTKRGIDGNSEVYLRVRDKMIEGMKVFTSYTNQWKSKELVAQSKECFEKTAILSVEEIKKEVNKIHLNKTAGVTSGSQFKPILPRPEKKTDKERISFVRAIKDIRIVSKHLFGVPNRNVSQVGEECFDLIKKEALGNE
ncbi:MAG: ATP-binding protein [Candidatus Omnitrophica bacterium]|nr:ATP-binding protein [Candidatus Omnitrophota bacterium]